MFSITTDEEKRLIDIVLPYFDFSKCDLMENSPIEAVEALKRIRKIGKEDISPNNEQQNEPHPCRKKQGIFMLVNNIFGYLQLFTKLFIQYLPILLCNIYKE